MTTLFYRLLFVFALAAGCFKASAQTVLKIIDGADVNARLEASQLNFTDASEPNKATGQGTIYYKIGPIEKSAGVDFTSTPIYVTPDRTRVVGGQIKLPSEVKEKNILKSGLGLEVPRDSFIKFTTQPSATKTQVEFLAPAGKALKIVFPFKKKTGTQTQQVEAALQTLTIWSDGTFDVNGQLNLTKAPDQAIEIGVVSLYQATVNWRLFRLAGQTDAEFSLKLPTAEFGVALQGAKNPTLFTVANLNVNNNGEVSFTNATFTGNHRVEFCYPQGLAFEVRTAQASMTNNVLTLLDVGGNIELPKDFSTTAGGTATVILKNATLKLQQNISGVNEYVATIKELSADLQFFWNDFGVRIKKEGTGAANSTMLVIDLSELSTPAGLKDIDGNALPGTWKGLYIRNLEFLVPELLTSNFDPSNRTTVAVTDFYLSGTGISGKVHASNPTGIPGLRVPFGDVDNGKLTILDCKILNNSIVDFSAEGDLPLVEMGVVLDVRVGMSNSGAVSIVADTSSPIPVGALGPNVSLVLESGAYNLTPAGVSQLTLSGAFLVAENATGVYQKVAGASLGFTGLSIDSNGRIRVTGLNLDLPSPVHVGVGPVDLVLNQVKFNTVPLSSDPNQNTLEVLLYGEVSVSDLPISGSLGFEGLSISKNGVKVKGISLLLDVENIGYLDVSVSEEDYTLPGSSPPETLSVFKGNGDFFLEALGTTGAGGSVSFTFWRGGWFAQASFTLTPPVTLGNTPLQLRAVKAGLGRNVESSTGVFLGVPGEDYELRPASPYNGVTDTKKWIFTAGVRISHMDQFSVWGDLTLTAAFGGGFVLDITGKLALLELYSAQADAMTQWHDRLIVANLNLDTANGTFNLSATADLYVPSKAAYNAKAGIRGYGTVQLLYESNPTKRLLLRIGGDVMPGSPPTFVDPVLVHARFGPVDASLQAALITEVKFSGNSISQILAKLGALINYQVSASGRVDWAHTNYSVVANMSAYAMFAAQMGRDSSDKLALQYLYGQFGLGLNLQVTLDPPVVDPFTIGGGADLAVEAWWANNNAGFGGVATGNIWFTVKNKNFGTWVSVPFGNNPNRPSIPQITF